MLKPFIENARKTKRFITNVNIERRKGRKILFLFILIYITLFGYFKIFMIPGRNETDKYFTSLYTLTSCNIFNGTFCSIV